MPQILTKPLVLRKDEKEAELPFAEHISKITVSPETPDGLLRKWEEDYDIHAVVIHKS